MATYSTRRPLRLLATCIALSLLQSAARAQDLSGSWKGVANLAGSDLTIVFHIRQVGTTWLGTFDCPSQNAYNLSITAIEFPSADSVVIELPTIDAEFRGAVTNDAIKGTFKQGNGKSPLMLKKMPNQGSGLLGNKR